MNIPRCEYPRPQMVRENWTNLNGEWQFEIDNGKSGRNRDLQNATLLKDKIIVPFCPESCLSGVGNKDFMAAVWYKKEIDLSDEWVCSCKKTILHIGACDYKTEVWVNGKSVGNHIGGYISFSFDITPYITAGKNVITICADDDLRSGTQPGGKQCYNYYSEVCSYTRTTGIWQTVWLENVSSTYIKSTKYTTIPETSTLYIEAECVNAHGKVLSATSKFDGINTGSSEVVVSGVIARLEIKLTDLHLWSAGSPNLYDLELTLENDKVDSYFGMRSIVYNDQKILINGKPIFQRLILDQGFYPDGIYTAPTDAELIADIQRSLDMGFNGARLHEKIFEPRFLYHCDKMGYLVWGEHANWGLDLAKPEAWQGFIPEWLEAIKRDFNHPAIVGWCPLNETQGNQNNFLVEAIVNITKAYDNTRPVIDASGWTHHLTDIMDDHDYNQDPIAFKATYEPLKTNNSNLSFISEYGGIWWNPGDEHGWGYGTRPASEDEFIARYKGLTEVLLSHPKMCAFCYTQLTDVEQEVNGLYTYDRKAKFNPEIIKAINAQKANIEIE